MSQFLLNSILLVLKAIHLLLLLLLQSLCGLFVSILPRFLHFLACFFCHLTGLHGQLLLFIGDVIQLGNRFVILIRFAHGTGKLVDFSNGFFHFLASLVRFLLPLLAAVGHGDEICFFPRFCDGFVGELFSCV